MYNWSTDTKEIRKKGEDYTLWKLQQKINFGLNNEKLDFKDLKKYWDKLEIDRYRRKFLEFIIYGKKHNYRVSKKGN